MPNHTGWDHVWIKNHPEYYTKNAKGEIIDPINPETGKVNELTTSDCLNLMDKIKSNVKLSESETDILEDE